MLFDDRTVVTRLVPRNPTDVRASLAARVDPRRFPFDSGDKEFIGEVREHSFELWVRADFRNDFAPCLRGTLDQVAEGTHLRASIGLRPLTKSFMLFWLGMVAIFGLILWGALLCGQVPPDARREAMIVPPTMICAGLFMTWMGRLVGRSQERKLLGLIEQLGDQGYPT